MSVQRYRRTPRAGLSFAQAMRIAQIYGKPAKQLGEYARSAYKSYYGESQGNVAQPIVPPKPRKKKKMRKNYRASDRKMCQVQSALKTLKRHDDASLGTLTYRGMNSGYITAGVNSQNAANFGAIRTTEIEAVLAQLKFFNPSVPGTLTTASGVAGTYQRNVLIDTITNKCTFTNNYQSDVDVRIYLCTVSDDTASSPYSAWSNAVVDGSNLSAVTQLGHYPTDYNQFNDLWKTKIAYKGVISPGKSVIVSNTVRDIEYDSATVDAHNLSYQKEYKAQVYLCLIKGTPMHDTAVAGEVTNGPCGLDVINETTFKVTYNAGINISTLYVDNAQTSAFTNGGVQSHQPIADNIGYSVA